MRTCAIQIAYPVWADLVPSVAKVIDQYNGFVHLETLGAGMVQCFRLTMIVAPEHFDPVREVEGPPPHLNALSKALSDRSIPFDAQMVDLDEPWRDTKHLLRHRRTTDLTLEASQFAFEFPPIQDERDPLDEFANVFMTCMLAPDDEVAVRDLDVWAEMAPELDQTAVAMLIVSAVMRDRLVTHLRPLIDAGLKIDDAALNAADAIMGDAVMANGIRRPKDPQWRFHLHHTDRVYKDLISRMGCTPQAEKAQAGAKRR